MKVSRVLTVKVCTWQTGRLLFGEGVPIPTGGFCDASGPCFAMACANELVGDSGAVICHGKADIGMASIVRNALERLCVTLLNHDVSG